MTLPEVMGAIEGHRFAAEVNLAAGFQAFRGGIQNRSLFRELAGRAKDPGGLKRVLTRLIELSRKQIQPQYENPFDSAMAAYLMAVDMVDPEVASVAAEAVSKAPNCWWANQVSIGIEISASLRRLGVPPARLIRNVVAAGGQIGHAALSRRLAPERRIDGRGCHHTRKRRTGNRAA